MKRILNYPGSKWLMAGWIIDHMPQHQVYLEPFFGSGAVFFNKPVSPVETINDIDGRLVNMFRVMRDHADVLARKVSLTPYARTEYNLSLEIAVDPIEDARRMLIRYWFSIGGKTNAKNGWRCLTGLNGSRVAHDWTHIPDRIKEVSDRLKGTQIESYDALDLIQRYNKPEVLIYADPPYMKETVSNNHYENEMSYQQHADLLEVLEDHEGPVLLSGYIHELYVQRLNGWTCIEKDSNTLNGTKKKECLWLNKEASKTVQQMNLFELETIG